MSQPTPQARSAQRRLDIVQTAWRLICERGYDATSLNTIITELGISKGSCYHHFPSKDAVVDAVVEMITTEVTQRVASDNAQACAIERLSAFVRSGWEWHEDHRAVSAEMMLAMLRPANRELLARVTAIEHRVLEPLLLAIIEQGETEGVFAVPDARLSTDLILLLYSQAMVRSLRGVAAHRLNATEFTHHINVLLDAVERLLGAETGSLQRDVTQSSRAKAVLKHFVSDLQTTATSGSPSLISRGA